MSQLQLIPKKKSWQEFNKEVSAIIQNGDDREAIGALVEAKKLEKAFTLDKKTKEAVLDRLRKAEDNKVTVDGALIELKSKKGGEDFTICGDPILDGLQKMAKEIAEHIDRRKLYLRSISKMPKGSIDEETAEMKMGETAFIKVRLMITTDIHSGLSLPEIYWEPLEEPVKIQIMPSVVKAGTEYYSITV